MDKWLLSVAYIKHQIMVGIFGYSLQIKPPNWMRTKQINTVHSSFWDIFHPVMYAYENSLKWLVFVSLTMLILHKGTANIYPDRIGHSYVQKKRLVCVVK